MSVLHLIWVKPPYQQIKNTTWHSFRQDDEGHTCLGFLKAHHDCLSVCMSARPPCCFASLLTTCLNTCEFLNLSETESHHLWHAKHNSYLMVCHEECGGGSFSSTPLCRKITSDLLISGGAHTCFSQENVSRRDRNCFWTEAFRCGEWFATPSSLTPVPSYWVSDESRGWPLMDL